MEDLPSEAQVVKRDGGWKGSIAKRVCMLIYFGCGRNGVLSIGLGRGDRGRWRTPDSSGVGQLRATHSSRMTLALGHGCLVVTAPGLRAAFRRCEPRMGLLRTAWGLLGSSFELAFYWYSKSVFSEVTQKASPASSPGQILDG